MPLKLALSYPPRFEICGDTGWITSEAVGNSLTSHDLRCCRRSGSVREATSHDPSRRDYRTPAAYAAAELSGRVNSGPTWTGCSHPMLYRARLCTILNRDRHSLYMVYRSQGPAISGLSAAGTTEKMVCFIRNRAEAAACATGQTMPIWTSS